MQLRALPLLAVGALLVQAGSTGASDVIVHNPTAFSTQSSTSIAANSTGMILIAGYNDDRGFPPPGDPTLSLSGVARSADGGATWNEVLVGPSRNPGTLP